MSVIDVHRLRKRYGSTVAVDDVGFTVERGEIFGILGPNGAGKSTTVECLSGLRRPDSGEVAVLGYDPVRDRGAVRSVLGAQLQESRLPDKMRAGEAVELFAAFYADPADPDRLLGDLGLEGSRDTAFENLSGGQQQRLSIALALVGQPQIAVLDELTTGLDPQSRRETWALIEAVRDTGVTVVLVTHFMEEAERLCDRIAVIDRGRVAALGTPAELVGQAGVGERVRLRVDAPVDDALVAALSALPAVGAVHRGDGGAVSVEGSGGRHGPLAAEVGRAVHRHGAAVTELVAERSGLDDVFLALTREHGAADGATAGSSTKEAA